MISINGAIPMDLYRYISKQFY